MDSKGLIILMVLSFTVLTTCIVLAIVFLKDCKQMDKIVKEKTEKQEEDNND